MFSDELLDFGSYKREGLLETGIDLGELDGDGVNIAFKYTERYSALNNNDAFALAFAKIEKCMLLAGDGALRSAVTDENVEVHGHLWLADEMKNHGTVTRKRLLSACRGRS